MRSQNRFVFQESPQVFVKASAKNFVRSDPEHIKSASIDRGDLQSCVRCPEHSGNRQTGSHGIEPQRRGGGCSKLGIFSHWDVHILRDACTHIVSRGFVNCDGSQVLCCPNDSHSPPYSLARKRSSSLIPFRRASPHVNFSLQPYWKETTHVRHTLV